MATDLPAAPVTPTPLALTSEPALQLPGTAPVMPLAQVASHVPADRVAVEPLLAALGPCQAPLSDPSTTPHADPTHCVIARFSDEPMLVALEKEIWEDSSLTAGRTVEVEVILEPVKQSNPDQQPDKHLQLLSNGNIDFISQLPRDPTYSIRRFLNSDSAGGNQPQRPPPGFATAPQAEMEACMRMTLILDDICGPQSCQPLDMSHMSSP